MKELIAAVLSAALLISNSAVPSCDHSWIEATRTSPRTCVICNKTDGEPLSLHEAYPDGQVRYQGDLFTMNPADFLALYLEDLQEAGYDYQYTGLYEKVTDTYIKYYIQDSTGQTLSVGIVYEPDTERVALLSVGFEMSLDSLLEADLDSINSAMDATYIALETCHGAFTSAKWDGVLNEDSEIGYAGDAILIKDECDGLMIVIVQGESHFEFVVTPDKSFF